MDLSKIELERIDGTKESMEKYLGNILLIVNTASKCGFTPQYEALEALYKKYHEKGFEILGFPCNQFKEQEPEEESKIAEFCKLNYGVTFPLFKNRCKRQKYASALSVSHRKERISGVR